MHPLFRGGDASIFITKKELMTINTQYIYPANLKAAANLWLWSLGSVCVIGVCALLSVLALAQLKTVLPLGMTAGYAFLTIRMDDQTILDFLRNATRFFISTQQHYEWKRHDAAVISRPNKAKTAAGSPASKKAKGVTGL